MLCLRLVDIVSEGKVADEGDGIFWRDAHSLWLRRGSLKESEKVAATYFCFLHGVFCAALRCCKVDCCRNAFGVARVCRIPDL